MIICTHPSATTRWIFPKAGGLDMKNLKPPQILQGSHSRKSGLIITIPPTNPPDGSGLSSSRTGKGLDLPIIVHNREAPGHIRNAKNTAQGVPTVFGRRGVQRQIVNLSMYIGLSGTVTFKNAKKPVRVAEFVPWINCCSRPTRPTWRPFPPGQDLSLGA